MRKSLFVILVSVVAASSVLVLKGWGEPPVRFPHPTHLEAGLECATCHPAAEAENMKSSLMPDKTVCLDCHESSDLAAWGYATIPEPEMPVQVADFSHKAHLAMGKTCEDCHAAVTHPESGLPPTALAGHPVCFQCHNGVRASDDCATCHQELRTGLLPGYRYDPNTMQPMSHHPQWLYTHQFEVRLDGTECSDCHKQEDYCSRCHMGENVVVQSHPRNWLYTHPLSAQKNIVDCQACHELGSFCSDCHLSAGIKPGDHAQPGWTAPPYLHAQAGRHDIEMCASCHEENHQGCSTNTICHRDDGVRGNQPNRNIHPAGFRDDVEKGYWHDDPMAACFDCHTDTRMPGVGFCGYCHGAK